MFLPLHTSEPETLRALAESIDVPPALFWTLQLSGWPLKTSRILWQRYLGPVPRGSDRIASSAVPTWSDRFGLLLSPDHDLCAAEPPPESDLDPGPTPTHGCLSAVSGGEPKFRSQSGHVCEVLVLSPLYPKGGWSVQLTSESDGSAYWSRVAVSRIQDAIEGAVDVIVQRNGSLTRLLETTQGLFRELQAVGVAPSSPPGSNGAVRERRSVIPLRPCGSDRGSGDPGDLSTRDARYEAWRLRHEPASCAYRRAAAELRAELEQVAPELLLEIERGAKRLNLPVYCRSENHAEMLSRKLLALGIAFPTDGLERAKARLLQGGIRGNELSMGSIEGANDVSAPSGANGVEGAVDGGAGAGETSLANPTRLATTIEEVHEQLDGLSIRDVAWALLVDLLDEADLLTLPSKINPLVTRKPTLVGHARGEAVNQLLSALGWFEPASGSSPPARHSFVASLRPDQPSPEPDGVG